MWDLMPSALGISISDGHVFAASGDGSTLTGDVTTGAGRAFGTEHTFEPLHPRSHFCLSSGKFPTIFPAYLADLLAPILNDRPQGCSRT